MRFLILSQTAIKNIELGKLFRLTKYERTAIRELCRLMDKWMHLEALVYVSGHAQEIVTISELS